MLNQYSIKIQEQFYCRSVYIIYLTSWLGGKTAKALYIVCCSMRVYIIWLQFPECRRPNLKSIEFPILYWHATYTATKAFRAPYNYIILCIHFRLVVYIATCIVFTQYSLRTCVWMYLIPRFFNLRKHAWTHPLGIFKIGLKAARRALWPLNEHRWQPARRKCSSVDRRFYGNAFYRIVCWCSACGNHCASPSNVSCRSLVSRSQTAPPLHFYIMTSSFFSVLQAALVARGQSNTQYTWVKTKQRYRFFFFFNNTNNQSQQ